MTEVVRMVGERAVVMEAAMAVVAGLVREVGRVVGAVMGETGETDQVAAETEVAVVMAVTMGEEKVVVDLI